MRPNLVLLMRRLEVFRAPAGLLINPILSRYFWATVRGGSTRFFHDYGCSPTTHQARMESRSAPEVAQKTALVNSRKTLRLVMASLLFSFFCASLFAQSDTASITGYVRDQSTGGIPKASVLVRNEGTGFERRTATNEVGHYIVSNLPPGYYTITVEAAGFKKSEKSQNKLDPNISGTVDVLMTIGDTTETVNVVAEAQGVQSESATLGRIITGKEVKDLPLNGRNPLFLALLKPGVSGGALAQFSFDLTTGGLNINGGRSQDNLITMDGAVGVRTRSNGSTLPSLMVRIGFICSRLPMKAEVLLMRPPRLRFSSVSSTRCMRTRGISASTCALISAALLPCLARLSASTTSRAWPAFTKRVSIRVTGGSPSSNWAAFSAA